MSDPAASYARTYVEQAVAFAQQGRLDEAITSLQYALQWQPGR